MIGRLAGGFRRFHKNIAARPPFWRQSLGKVWGKSGAKVWRFQCAFSVFPSAFLCSARFCWLAKKVWRQSLFARPWGARPFPAHTRRHRRAPKPSTIPHGRLTRTVLCRGASVLRPPLLHSAPKSGAKSGAKVWILKVWSKV